MTTFPVVPFVLATALAVNGARSRKLSPSGAATAFVVGFLVMAAPVRAIGVTLITFYLLASRATKYGKKRKAQLEEGFQDAGYRTGWQVLCNSIAAFIASIIWSVTFTPNVLPWSLLPSVLPVEGPLYDTESWCPLSASISNGLSRALLFIVLGQFACCLGDTLASELGILSSSRPILITTLKPVPPGTNGAISVGGTLASVAGGCVVGLTLFASLVVENRVCRADWMGILPSLVLWGTAAGVLGSMLDSFLGATIQRTRYSVDSKRVLQDASVPRDKESIKVIGGLNLLTNNQVNLISSVATAVVVALLA
ncbi:integral membrane protein DUF92-domain-containing protein [Pisolithus tinctorius]|uniref:Transmembrane protein 19 n=1 Tax=Pisolithus tinctorius Marx 270 TaxID=870435 RepID=A0A0C3P3J5_PISTI|nr:integral membrane protein DUF92-domain-containing protein [Pisolithus tinctorius]KIO00759.1 hypothetical protein M404DRAFT_1003772 [Pisolithus tinctorius Marx 270]KIO02046.1 hypothetical protein M404DRAFT_148703 [Pisolithus tinctorius Marx 270]